MTEKIARRAALPLAATPVSSSITVTDTATACLTMSIGTMRPKVSLMITAGEHPVSPHMKVKDATTSETAARLRETHGGRGASACGWGDYDRATGGAVGSRQGKD